MTPAAGASHRMPPVIPSPKKQGLPTTSQVVLQNSAGSKKMILFGTWGSACRPTAVDQENQALKAQIAALQALQLKSGVSRGGGEGSSGILISFF